MSNINYPTRIFSLSDCHGGQAEWHPFKSPDVAARIAEAIRSDLPGLQHFDTYGVPSHYYDHIVREVVRLHRDNPNAGMSGLFINSAPRTESKKNGDPFYLAEFEHNVRIVTTPLSALSAVKKYVKKLWFLPNMDNNLYDGSKEQHRSSYVLRMLADNHGLNLEEADPNLIPDLPHGCALAYVDRFGNMVLYETEVDKQGSLRQRVSQGSGEVLALKIGKAHCDLQVGVSLSEADPGGLFIYTNDGSIEIVRKWSSSWGPQKRFDQSAWSQFEYPSIGEQCGFLQ